MASPSSQMVYPSRLLAIPFEVLINITSYLTTPEYGGLRVVCRHLDASLFQPFAREFFTKKAFILTEFSLQALVDISNSRFGPSLKCLIINLERPGTIQWSAPNSISREEFYNHKTLMSSGRDVELITEALRNLPNLETFGLRDFPSSGRYRDGGAELWRPYGAQTFERQTGAMLSRPSFNYNNERQMSANLIYVCHAFLTSLRALGHAKMAHCPPRLEVILRHCHIPDFGFNIPRYLEPTILPVLQDLKVLFLDLGRLTFPSYMVKMGAIIEAYPGFLATLFLSKLQSLEHLRLNFRDCADGAATPLFRWLAQSPPTLQTLTAPVGPALGVGSDRVPSLPDAPSLPRLEQLDIGMITTELFPLLGLFRRYKSSLRKISLHRVRLQPGGLTGDEPVKTNLWARFLDQTTKLGINISSIELSEIELSDHIGLYPVEFRDPHRMSVATHIFKKGWAGSDWERGSRELIDSLFVDLHDDDTEDEDDGMEDYFLTDLDEFSEMDEDEDEELDDDGN